jgi:hypothetical protein
VGPAKAEEKRRAARGVVTKYVIRPIVDGRHRLQRVGLAIRQSVALFTLAMGLTVK